jgi:acyl carrier protein
VAPRNPFEEAVAEIWSEVLGIERISVHDSFFALGGHSLLATQVTSRVFETFQVDLPLRRLFAQGTVAGVAEAILEEQLGHLSEEERRLLARADQLSEEQLEAELAQMKGQERG